MQKTFRLLFQSANFCWAGLLFACAPAQKNAIQIPEGQTIEMQTAAVIIGENNLQDVQSDLSNLDPKLREVSNAVGKIDPGCTVTHIGNHLAITAGHCFLFAQGLPAIQKQPCSQLVSWGLRADGLAQMQSTCTEIISAEWTDKLDYAMIRVSDAPVEKVKMRFWKNIYRGTRLTAFSHPKGKNQQWSGDCKSLGTASSHKNFFNHECDTEKGSSGAGIFAFVRGKPVLVGIHVRGIEQGPTQPVATNTAMKLSAIPRMSLSSDF